MQWNSSGSERIGAAAAIGRCFETDMVEKYAPVVRRIASSLYRMRPAHLDHDDSVQDGMIALLWAIRTNRNNDEGRQFLCYLKTRIRGAIIDRYRDSGGISRRDYADAVRVRQTIAHGGAVTSAERESARRVMTAAWMAAAPLDGDASENLASPHPGPEQRLMCNEALRKAIAALQQVSVRDRTIFIACEIHGDKQVDVAADFGISVGRVSQIVKKVRRDVICAVA